MNQYAKSNTAKTPHKMADGGSVGLFERLAAGNIDDPTSSAYKRWGAGSKAEAAAPSAEPAAPSRRVESDSEQAHFQEANASPVEDTSDADSEKVREGRRTSPTSAPKAPSKPKPKPTAARSAPAASVNRQSVTGGFAGGVASGASKTASDRAQPQSAKSRRHEEEMDDTPLARGLKSVGRFVKSMAPDGTGNKSQDGSPSIYAGEAAWKQFRAGKGSSATTGMANGGMVGGAKSYGKKG